MLVWAANAACAIRSAPRLSGLRRLHDQRDRPGGSDLPRRAHRAGLDPETGRGTGTVAAIELDFNGNTAAQPLDPRQGYAINAHMEKAGPWLRGTFEYTELSGEVRGYVPLGSRFVWANRARSGTLAGPSSSLIPSIKVFRRRLQQRPRLGALSGESAHAVGTAHRRQDDDGGVDGSAVQHSRQARWRAVRRRR